MNNYFEEVFEKLNQLSDEEFDKLLLDSGIERCPYDMMMFSMFSTSKNKKFKEVYRSKINPNDIDNEKYKECDKEYDERKRIA